MKKHTDKFLKKFGPLFMIAALVSVFITAGCQGDSHTYQRHVEDVQQDVQQKVIVE